MTISWHSFSRSFAYEQRVFASCLYMPPWFVVCKDEIHYLHILIHFHNFIHSICVFNIGLMIEINIMTIVINFRLDACMECMFKEIYNLFIIIQFKHYPESITRHHHEFMNNVECSFDIKVGSLHLGKIISLLIRLILY
jgi:hypothetical protein